MIFGRVVLLGSRSDGLVGRINVPKCLRGAVMSMKEGETSEGKEC
jgi:hypothetical protein